MNVLLDTHIALWARREAAALRRKMRYQSIEQKKKHRREERPCLIPVGVLLLK